jgi:hypothetical protein
MYGRQRKVPPRSTCPDLWPRPVGQEMEIGIVSGFRGAILGRSLSSMAGRAIGSIYSREGNVPP